MEEPKTFDQSMKEFLRSQKDLETIALKVKTDRDALLEAAKRALPFMPSNTTMQKELEAAIVQAEKKS